MIDLRTMMWGDDPGLCRWAQCNHWGPFQGSREMRDHRKDGMVDKEAVAVLLLCGKETVTGWVEGLCSGVKDSNSHRRACT